MAMITILNHQGDRATHRDAVTHPTDDLDGIVFDFLPTTTTIAALPGS